MNLKSKHGAGGEYAPDWHPKVRLPTISNLSQSSGSKKSPHKQIEAPPPEAPPPQALEPAPPVQARPGWRVVHKRPERRQGLLKGAAAPASPPPPTLVPAEPPRPELPAWQNWRRQLDSNSSWDGVLMCCRLFTANPLLAPTPGPSAAVPNSPAAPNHGLFGVVLFSVTEAVHEFLTFLSLGPPTPPPK